MRIGLKWRVSGSEPAPQWASAGTVTAGPRARVAVPPLSGFSLSAVAAAFGACLAAEEDRWFVWRAAAFAAGIVAYFGLHTEPSLALALGVALAGLAVAALGRRADRIGIRFLCALVAAAGLGFGAAKLRTDSIAAPVIARETGPVDIEGRIESVEIRAANRARIVLAPSKIEGHDGPAAPRAADADGRQSRRRRGARRAGLGAGGAASTARARHAARL